MFGSVSVPVVNLDEQKQDVYPSNHVYICSTLVMISSNINPVQLSTCFKYKSDESDVLLKPLQKEIAFQWL